MNYRGERISFKPGYDALPGNKAKEVKESIMLLLDITSRTSWHRYLNGKIYITNEMKRDITKIFNENKIRKAIWKECS